MAGRVQFQARIAQKIIFVQWALLRCSLHMNQRLHLAEGSRRCCRSSMVLVHHAPSAPPASLAPPHLPAALVALSAPCACSCATAATSMDRRGRWDSRPSARCDAEVSQRSDTQAAEGEERRSARPFAATASSGAAILPGGVQLGKGGRCARGGLEGEDGWGQCANAAPADEWATAQASGAASRRSHGSLPFTLPPPPQSVMSWSGAHLGAARSAAMRAASTHARLGAAPSSPTACSTAARERGGRRGSCSCSSVASSPAKA